MDEEDFMAKAFQVDVRHVDGRYDPNLPPSTGNEYLLRVQEEAKRCPSVVVADMDTSKFVSNQTVTVTSSSGCLPPPEGFSPSWQWQKSRLADFSDVRQRLAAYKARGTSSRSLPVDLPKLDDDIGWCQMCFGSRASSATEDSLAVGCPPLLSMVAAMSQPVVEQVLTYHTSWLEVTGFTQQQGRWFYALLSCLEKPLTPETCSSLRTLARACANLRATLPDREDPRLAPLNLFVCLIAHYFDQKDLADF